MIPLTRLNHSPFYLNAGLIEHIESTPDTMITLTTGQKYLVMESTGEVVDRFMACQRQIHALGPADAARLLAARPADAKE